MKLLDAIEIMKLVRRIKSGELEIAYARDGENGYYYVTLKTVEANAPPANPVPPQTETP